jgi:hypothetical protein
MASWWLVTCALAQPICTVTSNIMTEYKLVSQGIRIWVLVGARNISLFHSIQTSSGSQGTGSAFCGVKQPCGWRWPTTHSSAKVNLWTLPPLPHRDMDNFTNFKWAVKLCSFMLMVLCIPGIELCSISGLVLYERTFYQYLQHTSLLNGSKFLIVIRTLHRDYAIVNFMTSKFISIADPKFCRWIDRFKVIKLLWL